MNENTQIYDFLLFFGSFINVEMLIVHKYAFVERDRDISFDISKVLTPKIF